MMREFKIEKDPYNDKEYLYKKNKIQIESGITVLVGCNGSGKTTLISYIKEDLDKNEIPYISYNNLKDGGLSSKSKAVYNNNLRLMSAMWSSEGEFIKANLEEVARTIANYQYHKYKDSKELWILLDAVDSGYSIDNCACLALHR